MNHHPARQYIKRHPALRGIILPIYLQIEKGIAGKWLLRAVRGIIRWLESHPRLRAHIRRNRRLRLYRLILRLALVGDQAAADRAIAKADFAHFRRLWRSNNVPGIGNMPGKQTVVMVSVSNMRVDPRIEREARALAKAGFEVVVIWPDFWKINGISAPIDWGPGITFDYLPASAGWFTNRFPGFLGKDMLDAALKHRPLAFHGHDIPSALVALTAAQQTGAFAVCDYHEWFSENVSWDAEAEKYIAHPSNIRKAYRCLERFSLRRATEVITVCDSIADEMSEQFSRGSRKIHVIRNIPDLHQSGKQPAYLPLKEQLGLSADTFVVLWQGGVGPSRMIEPIIDALALAPGWVFVIRGPGLDHYGPEYRTRAKSLKQLERLIFLPSVPSADVVAAANGADVGIWTLPNLCKNFSYALPNKIFEYLAAGLPVLAAHYVEAKGLVEGKQVGLCFDPYDPQSISDAVTALMRDPLALARCRARIPAVLSALSADTEWDKIVRIYNKLREHASGLRALPLTDDPMTSEVT